VYDGDSPSEINHEILFREGVTSEASSILCLFYKIQ
jgi:hypothetical protein